LDREQLIKIVHEKGEDWAISAIVDGSIGYHSPSGAKKRVEELLKGEQVWGCERDYALFGGDGLRAIAHDFGYFLDREKYDAEEVKAIIQVVKLMLQKADWPDQVGFSMAYPTIAF